MDTFLHPRKPRERWGHLAKEMWKEDMATICSGSREKHLPWTQRLNTGSRVGGNVWVGLGGVALLDDHFGVSKALRYSQCFHSASCLRTKM